MNVNAQSAKGLAIPFDHHRLDRLMDEAGIDVVLATSKHNVQYLLGGHRADFFDYMDATGITRYLPVVIYPKGVPDKAVYVGHRLEKWQAEANPMWTPTTHTASNGSVDGMTKAVESMKKLGLKPKRIGAELGFLPYDAALVLKKAFPDAELVEATLVLDRQRVVKRPDELKKLKIASEAVLDSMMAVIANHGPGTTTRELVEALRREEVNRGLTFEYCLITAGASHNRAPSEQPWQKGEVLSIDSGGNYHGYIGDLCRMGILGEPDAELEDLLAEVETVQQAAFSKVKAGTLGGDMISHAEGVLKKSKVAPYTDFFAHGMGLITHEAPFLMTNHPVAYEGTYADKPLEKNMVLSVETTMLHPTRGFIKLEDTLAVTETGYVMFGDRGRGWNRGGTL